MGGRREEWGKVGKIFVVGGQKSVLGTVRSYFQTVCERRKTKENT